MSNNKQSMKLYTKEDFLKAAEFCEVSMIDAKYIIERIDEVSDPIELPSDEEIKQQSHIQYPVNLQPNGRTMAGGKYDIDINYSERNAFIECAKWMRDKIQGGNK